MAGINPLFDADELGRVMGAQGAPEAAPEPGQPPAPPPAAGEPAPTKNPLLFDPSMVEKPAGLPREAYEKMPALEVGARALKAAPSSVAGLVKGTIEPFYPENIPGTLMGAGQMAAGAVSKGVGAMGFEQDPAEKEKTEAALNAVAEHYKDKYGSVAGVKQALAEDPAGVMADISSVLTLGGGAAARVPGMIGTAGRIAKTAGEVAGPITGPAKAAGAIAKGVSPAVNLALSGLSGISFGSLQEAAKSGVTGEKAFWNSLSGQVTPKQVVDDVIGSISATAADQKSNYLAGMSSLQAAKPLSFSPVDSAVNRAKGVARFGTININQKAAEALGEIESKINEWKEAAASDPMYQGIAGFDSLKRAIDDIITTNYKGTPADKVVSIVRNAVKEEIQKADPKYAKVMEDYDEAKSHLDDLRRELTVNRGAVGQNLRKLLRSLNDKYKNNLLQDIAEKDPDIFAKIAGQEVAHAHGHSGGVLQLGGLLSLLLQDPRAFAATLPAAVLGSPKVAASTAYGVQKATQPFISTGEAIGTKYSPVVAGAQLAREREGRATGGGVRAVTAQQLISMADLAKKSINDRTKEILKAPDEHVVKALDIANKHI